ncbi:hypothetical protein [Micromonospora coxensis]|uniref:hypothetical protein n=1 Tax=Micromonospora coxensis TaxID=356852 RepID=UPI00342DFA96
MNESTQWTVIAKYEGAPVKPYHQPDGPVPDESLARMSSAAICSDRYTTMTAIATASSTEEALRLAMPVIHFYASVYRLPGEPASLTIAR